MKKVFENICCCWSLVLWIISLLWPEGKLVLFFGSIVIMCLCASHVYNTKDKKFEKCVLLNMLGWVFLIALCNSGISSTPSTLSIDRVIICCSIIVSFASVLKEEEK